VPVSERLIVLPPAITRELTMRMGEFVPRPQPVERPLCEWCGAPMRLATIEPHRVDHDKRRFECPACRNVITEIVKYE